MEILPDRCTMIAKKELIYAGTVGLICWLGGIVFINRKKTSDAKSVMADAAKTMLDEQVTCFPSRHTLYQTRCFSAVTDRRPRRPPTDPSVGVSRGNAEPERGSSALQEGGVPPGGAGTGVTSS